MTGGKKNQDEAAPLSPELRRLLDNPKTGSPLIAKFASLDGYHSDVLIKAISRHQLIYAMLGLALGLVCIIGGIALFLAGVTGAMSWTAAFLGASSELYDAAPGAVLFIVGLFIVFVTRYKLQSRRR